MIKPKPPCPGDMLLDPPRMVSFVDRRKREFRCSRFAEACCAAPIEDDWTELPTDDILEGPPCPKPKP